MAFSYVQGNGSNTAGATTDSVALSGTTAGNLLVVWAVGAAHGGLSSLSISDNQGNVWMQGVAASASLTAMRSSILTGWFLESAPGGSITVTITANVTSAISVSIDEWNPGSGNTATLDTTANNTGTLSSSPTAGSMSTSATDMVSAAFAFGTTGLSYTAGSGYTLGYTTAVASQPVATEYDASIASGTITPGMSLSLAANFLAAAMAFTTSAIVVTHLYAADLSSGRESSLEFDLQVDIGSEVDGSLALGLDSDAPLSSEGFLAFLTASEQAVGVSGALGVPLTGDSGSGFEAVLTTILTETDVKSTDLGTGDDSGFLLIPWGIDVALESEAVLQSYVIWATDSGFADDSGVLSMITAAVAYVAVDPASSSESAPAPTAWASDLVPTVDVANAILWGGDTGGEAETGPGTGSTVLQTTTLIAVDVASVSEVASWSTLIFGVDAGFAGDLWAINIVTEGYYIYSNSGAGDPINYAIPIATILGFENTTWVSAGLTHPGTWAFAIRAYDGCGIEQNVDCVVTIVLDSAGNDITNTPAPPIGLRAFAVAGGGIKAEWYYPQVAGPRQPAGFNVYVTAGATISYAAPSAVVPYTTAFMNSFQATITGLIGGTSYVVGVRAYNATGEEKNGVVVTVIAVTTGPSAVIDLTAVAIV